MIDGAGCMMHREDTGERCVLKIYLLVSVPLPLINKGISVAHATLFSSYYA